MNFDKVYIQKTQDNARLVETVKDFDIYCADMPFKIAEEAKDLTSRDWADEDGEDEYIPPTGLKMKSYTMDVKFCCKGDKGSSNAKIAAFIDYLTGRDKTGAEMKMYCTWTRVGRKGIRFEKLNDDAELIRDDDGDILVFTVTFKVNDPVTDVSPVYGMNNEITGLG